MQLSLFSKRSRSAIVAGLILLGPLAASHGAADNDSSPAAMRARIGAANEKVRRALVRIRVVSTEFREGREVKMQAVGSGVIITKDGYLITNHHVAGHAIRMFCTLWNREEIEAELIGTDPLTDIAVLKLKPEKPREFVPASFGDSAALRVGDAVLAMGSPMALSQSVTLGIISNTEMVLPRFWGNAGRFQLDGEDVGALVRWIGHDAAIYGGNSGGPLCDLRGEIVGINEISYGLSGAIPINLVKPVAQQLIATGKIQRSWLGISPQPLLKEWEGQSGLLVAGVWDDSPATKAGLKAGDLLLSLAGQKINVRFDEQMPDFMTLSSGLEIGRPVPAVIKREGKEIEVSLVPLERGEVNPKQEELKPWGMAGRDFSFFLAKELKRTNLNGVLVTSVRPGGPAGQAKPPLERGDVLVAINGSTVKSIENLAKQTRMLTQGQNGAVPVMATFERRSARYLAVVQVGTEEEKDPGLEVTKAWLPVETRVISREIARQLGRPDLKGFYLTRVYEGSTAEKAGLLAGDFILALNGEKLTASGSENQDDLESMIRQYDVGKTVELSILRGTEEQKVSVTLARSPRLRREMKRYRNDDFEFTARNVSFFDTAEALWNQGQEGALIEEVKPGSWAELANLFSGDLVVEVDGQSVGNVDGLRQLMEKIAAARKPAVVMKVMRGIHTAYLELEPSWKN